MTYASETKIDTSNREAVLIIAARAHADPRTVVKVGQGENVRGDVRDRILRAARELNTAA